MYNVQFVWYLFKTLLIEEFIIKFLVSRLSRWGFEEWFKSNYELYTQCIYVYIKYMKNLIKLLLA